MWRTFRIALAGMAAVVLPCVSSAQQHLTVESRKRTNVNSAQQALWLLRTKLVQNEIGLRDDQKRELVPLTAALEKEFQDAYHHSREVVPGEPDQKMADEVKQVDARMKTTVRKILLPSQFSRLEEIGLQVCGPGLFTSRDILDSLGLSAEQHEKIDRVLDVRGRRLRELFARTRMNVPQIEPKDRDARTRQAFAEEDAIEKGAVDEILGLLSTHQRARLKDMMGKAIDVGRLKAELRGQEG